MAMGKHKAPTRTTVGKMSECKFCHKPVWFDRIMSRFFEPEGNVLHADVCEKRKAHFHQRALQDAETRRQRRNA